MDAEQIIRRAVAGDVAQIRSVAEESWAAAYAGIIDPEAQRRALSKWYATEALEAAIAGPGGVFLVAQVGARVEGFIHVSPPRNGDAELLRIYLAPDHARHGIGTRLLQAALSSCDPGEVARIAVAVADRNISGRAFYEKSGFVFAGSRTVEVFGMSIAEAVYTRGLGTGAA